MRIRTCLGASLASLWLLVAAPAGEPKFKVQTANTDPPVSRATRKPGASNDIRSQGTATTTSDTAAAPAAASDTVGSAGLRAGPSSICSTLRKTSEPRWFVPQVVGWRQGGQPHHRRQPSPISVPTRSPATIAAIAPVRAASKTCSVSAWSRARMNAAGSITRRSPAIASA